MVKKILFFTCFLSLVIPRSGTKIATIPLAIPSLLFGLLIWIWFLKEVILKRRFPRATVSGPILLYLCWGVIAFIRGIGSAGFTYLVQFTAAFVIFPIIFFMMISYFKTRDQLRYFLNMILVSLLIVSLYGFPQFLFGFQKVTIPGITMSYLDCFVPDPNLKQNRAEAPAGQKMFSTFHNGNVFGQHLVTFLPLIIVMFFETKKRSSRRLALMAGILTTVALVCTLSRGAAAGFLVSLIFLFLVTKRKHMKIFCITILLIGLLTGMIFNLKPRYVDQTKVYPTGMRLGRWRTNIGLIYELKDKPLINLLLFGSGFSGGVMGVEMFENTYLTMWLVMGIIGVGLFLWIFFKIFRDILIGVRLTEDPVILIFLVGGTAGILGALVHMSVDTLFFAPPIAQNFWMLVGLVAIAIKLAPITQNENQY